MEPLEKFIRIEALKNALRFKGKANDKVIIGRVMSEFPEYRTKKDEAITLIAKIVNEINAMSEDQQKKALEEIDTNALEDVPKKKVEEKGLPDLPNIIKGKPICMRMAPFPSGALHIGNARAFILNDYYVKRYKEQGYDAKLLLVYDDTIGSTLKELNSPDAKFVLPEAYDLIKEGLEWLDIKFEKPVYKSDRIDVYIKEAETMIRNNWAYACTCDSEVFREQYKKTGTDCPCRSRSIEQNLEIYQKMKNNEMEEGAAVIRIKMGMQLKDPAIRDNVIMRISDAPHPRIGTKVRLWPTLEFSWGLDDHLLGITHIIRGIDLVKEGVIEGFIWDLYGWEHPTIINYGRLKFSDEFKLSKTFQRNMIQKGEYSGWEDPRTWTLQSLKARGIYPEALRSAILDLKLSQRAVTFEKAWVYSYNKNIIDPKADRYWFVEDPIQLIIKDVPFKEFVSEPLLHPQNEARGKRKVVMKATNGTVKVWVSKLDLQPVYNSKNELLFEAIQPGLNIRLKDGFNVSIESIDPNKEIISKYLSNEMQNFRKIQWIPTENHVEVSVLRPEGFFTNGFGESAIKSLNIDQIIQFERYGFVRIKKIDKEKISCYFVHE